VFEADFFKLGNLNIRDGGTTVVWCEKCGCLHFKNLTLHIPMFILHRPPSVYVNFWAKE
jgi:hypothetical protein